MIGILDHENVTVSIAGHLNLFLYIVNGLSDIDQAIKPGCPIRLRWDQIQQCCPAAPTSPSPELVG